MFIDCDFRDPIEFEDAVLIPLGVRPSAPAIRALTKADYGSPLTEDELELYLKMSGGAPPPEGGSTRTLDILGRRSGKSETRARCALYEILCVPHYRYLAPGQVGVFAIIAQEREIANEVFRYLAGYRQYPELAPYFQRVYDTTNDSRIVFANGIEARVITANKKSVRGPTYIGGVLDEIAFWEHDGEFRDVDIIDAFTPGLARSISSPPRRVWAISSANIKSGWAWQTYRDCYGRADTPWTVRSAPSLFIRPDLDESEIVKDCFGRPGKREREYECRWSDTTGESFFGDLVSACVDAGRTCERLPPIVDGLRYYVAIDPAFVHDEFSLAVVTSHLVRVPDKEQRQRRTEILHTTGWQPRPGAPLSPQVIAARIREICEHFGVRTVYSDQHESVSLTETLRQLGIKLVQRPWSQTSKRERFEAVRGAMLQSALVLPDDPILRAALNGVLAEPLPSGDIRIPKRSGDDRALAAVLAASEALAARPSLATRSLTPWEREERALAEMRLTFLGGPIG